MALRTSLRILLWILGLIGGGIAVLLRVVLIRWDRTFQAPYPEIHAGADTAVIARGRPIPPRCAPAGSRRSPEATRS
jgi:hypothetical protein